MSQGSLWDGLGWFGIIGVVTVVAIILWRLCEAGLLP
jgi:hypothetical protein